MDVLNIEKEWEALRGMGGTMTVEDKKSVKCEKSKEVVVGYEGESNMKCEKDKEVMVVRRKDMGVGRVRKRQVGECIEKGEKNKGVRRKRKGGECIENGEKEKGKKGGRVRDEKDKGGVKKTCGKLQEKDMNIDTKGEKEKGKMKKTCGTLQEKDMNIVTCQRVSVIVPLKQISVDQPCKFNTDLWSGHVGKHDTLDWGGDSDEMEMYMRGVII